MRVRGVVTGTKEGFWGKKKAEGNEKKREVPGPSEALVSIRIEKKETAKNKDLRKGGKESRAGH